MTIDLHACWTTHPLIFLDTETTSADPETCGLVEVAGVRVEGGSIVGEFCELVNPGQPIPVEATQVHGIDDAMVANAPHAADVQWALADFCAGAVPVAYNAPFDKRVILRHMDDRRGIAAALIESFSWIDVYVICASPRVDKYVKGKGRLKLSAVCERRGIPHESQHRALGDARATAALLQRLLADGHVNPCPLNKMLAHTDAMRAEQQRDFEQWRARQPKRETA